MVKSPAILHQAATPARPVAGRAVSPESSVNQSVGIGKVGFAELVASRLARPPGDSAASGGGGEGMSSGIPLPLESPEAGKALPPTLLALNAVASGGERSVGVAPQPRGQGELPELPESLVPAILNGELATTQTSTPLLVEDGLSDSIPVPAAPTSENGVPILFSPDAAPVPQGHVAVNIPVLSSDSGTDPAITTSLLKGRAETAQPAPTPTPVYREGTATVITGETPALQLRPTLEAFNEGVMLMGGDKQVRHPGAGGPETFLDQQPRQQRPATAGMPLPVNVETMKPLAGSPGQSATQSVLAAMMAEPGGSDPDAFRPEGFGRQDAPSLTAGQMQQLSALGGTRTAGPAAATPSFTLDLPMQHDGWREGLGERIVWMANQKMTGAELRLNPPQLGPIEVRVDVRQDQASVVFSSQQGVVREALEAAVPRLREMFGNAGLNLLDVSVSQHSLSQQRQQAGDERGTNGGVFLGDPGEEGVKEAPPEMISSLQGNAGLIDLFA